MCFKIKIWQDFQSQKWWVHIESDKKWCDQIMLQTRHVTINCLVSTWVGFDCFPFDTPFFSSVMCPLLLTPQAAATHLTFSDEGIHRSNVSVCSRLISWPMILYDIDYTYQIIDLSSEYAWGDETSRNFWRDMGMYWIGSSWNLNWNFLFINLV